MVSQLVGDVFGGLRIHTRSYNTVSNSYALPWGAALPLDESEGYPAARIMKKRQ